MNKLSDFASYELGNIEGFNPDLEAQIVGRAEQLEAEIARCQECNITAHKENVRLVRYVRALLDGEGETDAEWALSEETRKAIDEA